MSAIDIHPRSRNQKNGENKKFQVGQDLPRVYPGNVTGVLVSVLPAVGIWSVLRDRMSAGIKIFVGSERIDERNVNMSLQQHSQFPLGCWWQR